MKEKSEILFENSLPKFVTLPDQKPLSAVAGFDLDIIWLWWSSETVYEQKNLYFETRLFEGIRNFREKSLEKNDYRVTLCWDKRMFLTHKLSFFSEKIILKDCCENMHIWTIVLTEKSLRCSKEAKNSRKSIIRSLSPDYWSTK